MFIHKDGFNTCGMRTRRGAVTSQGVQASSVLPWQELQGMLLWQWKKAGRARVFTLRSLLREEGGGIWISLHFQKQTVERYIEKWSNGYLRGKCGRQNNGKPKMSVPLSLDPTNKWPCTTKGTSEDVIKVQDSDMWRWSLKSREPLLAVGGEDLAAKEGSERCCCVWRQRKRAKECGQPLEARNSKEMGPP